MTEENSLAASDGARAAEPPSKPLLSWQTATAIATASVGVGAVLLHAIGSIRHNVFLAQFGMDADLFPKSTDWLMLYGFYGVLDRANWGVLFLKGYWYWLPVVWVALGLYLFLLNTPIGEGEPGPITLWLKSKGAWAKRLIFSLILSRLAVWVSVVALLLILLVTIFISVVDKTAGLATAESAKHEFAEGGKNSTPKCIFQEIKISPLPAAIFWTARQATSQSLNRKSGGPTRSQGAKLNPLGDQEQTVPNNVHRGVDHKDTQNIRSILSY